MSGTFECKKNLNQGRIDSTMVKELALHASIRVLSPTIYMVPWAYLELSLSGNPREPGTVPGVPPCPHKTEQKEQKWNNQILKGLCEYNWASLYFEWTECTSGTWIYIQEGCNLLASHNFIIIIRITKKLHSETLWSCILDQCCSIYMAYNGWRDLKILICMLTKHLYSFLWSNWKGLVYMEFTVNKGW